MKELKKGRKLRGEKGFEEWERHKGERKDTASGIEREKCLRERDIFRHGGKIPAMGIGKRPEKIPAWRAIGNLPLGERKRLPLLYQCRREVSRKRFKGVRGTTWNGKG